MRFALPAVVAFAALALVAVADEEKKEPEKKDAPVEMTDNTTYLAWTKFKPGAWARVKDVSTEGNRTQTKKVTTKLLELTPEQVLLEYVNAEVLASGEMAAPAVKMAHPAKVPAIPALKPDDPAAPKTTRTEGTETLEVAGRKLECKTLEITIDSPALKSWSKVWRSDLVPGGVVKSEVKIESPSALTSSTILEEFATE